MNFRKSYKGGGGAFSIQKIILPMLELYNLYRALNKDFWKFWKHFQYKFPKMRGGGLKGRLEFFRKLICFGVASGHPSLIRTFNQLPQGT